MSPFRFVLFFIVLLSWAHAFAGPKIDLAPRPKATAKSAAGPVAGTWTGFYVQPIHIIGGGNSRTETRKISFTMHLRETAKGIEGEITETNQYGEDREKNPVLRATFKGKVEGNRVTFTKMYELSGGGIVEYSGELDPTRQHLSGAWKRDEESGGFEADLKQPQTVR